MIKTEKRRKSRKSQYSDKQILALLQDYNNQKDLSVSEFCKKLKIHKATFYNWRKRLNIQAKDSKGFLPVKVTPPVDVTLAIAQVLFAEVNGIRLYHFVSADYLKALLT